MKRDKHVRCDFSILKEASVYPGHPITVAYLITQVFDDFEEAARKGNACPNALEACAIPGAGGNVYHALDVLHYLRDGIMTWDRAMEHADEYWTSLGKSDARPSQEIEEGQAQAERVKPLLKAMEPWWRKTNVSAD